MCLDMKVLSLLRSSGAQLISVSAMKRMAVSNVLIVGVQGLGAEIGMLRPIQSKLWCL
jgi:hypothetical protein